jgi:hypothetical protein
MGDCHVFGYECRSQASLFIRVILGVFLVFASLSFGSIGLDI